MTQAEKLEAIIRESIATGREVVHHPFADDVSERGHVLCAVCVDEKVFTVETFDVFHLGVPVMASARVSLVAA